MDKAACFARITGGTEPTELEVALVSDDGTLTPVAPLSATVVISPGARTRVVMEFLVDELNLKRRDPDGVIPQSGQ